MKILHTESSLGWGGQEIRILSECDWFHLNSTGIRCSILSADGAQFISRSNVNSVEIKSGPISRKGLKALWFMWNFLASQKPDVIVTHSSTDSWLVTLAVCALFYKPTIIRMRHVSAPISGGSLTKWMYRKAKFVVTTSEAIKIHVQEALQISEHRVVSIPTGLNVKSIFCPVSSAEKVEARGQLGLAPDALTLGMLSTLRSWKGHEYVLDALESFPDATLLIGGDGPQEQNLKRIVLEKELGERVFFLGYLENPLPLLMASDIFLQPSYANEGLSQSLMQAMAMGLAVIASDIGGLNEMVISGKNGILVPPRDSAALVTALNGLIEDAELRDSLGSAARSWAERSCSIDNMGQQMQAIFERCIS